MCGCIVLGYSITNHLCPVDRNNSSACELEVVEVATFTRAFIRHSYL